MRSRQAHEVQALSGVLALASGVVARDAQVTQPRGETHDVPGHPVVSVMDGSMSKRVAGSKLVCHATTLWSAPDGGVAVESVPLMGFLPLCATRSGATRSGPRFSFSTRAEATVSLLLFHKGSSDSSRSARPLPRGRGTGGVACGMDGDCCSFRDALALLPVRTDTLRTPPASIGAPTTAVPPGDAPGRRRTSVAADGAGLTSEPQSGQVTKAHDLD